MYSPEDDNRSASTSFSEQDDGKPKSTSPQFSLKKRKISKKRADGINKGVTHNIKKPKIRKVKEKKVNKAKSYLRRTKNMPVPCLPHNRSPLKKNKLSKHNLSSPGVSLLDSPDSNIDSENEKKRLFTSRSRAAATIAITKGIKLASQSGKISITNRSGIERKNIGKKVEEELEQEIKNLPTLTAEKIAGSLDKITTFTTSTPLSSQRSGPTRFESSPSQKSIRRKSPLKKPVLTKECSPRQSTRRKTAFNSPKISQSETTTPRKTENTPLKENHPPYLHMENSSSPRQNKRLTPLSKALRNISMQSPKRSPRRLLASPSNSNRCAASPKRPITNVQNGNTEDDELIALEDVEENEILCSLLTDVSETENVLHSEQSKEEPSTTEGLRRSPRKKTGENVKYFPIFDSTRKVTAKDPQKLNKSKKRKLLKKSDPNQLIIDAGQKAFGAVKCDSCGLVYEIGDPDDEETHTEFHDSLLKSLKYSGWKAENQVTVMDYQGGCVFKVDRKAPFRHWRKVQEVLEHVDRELGHVGCGSLIKEKVIAFLYVVNQQICGLLIAEEISQAYKVIQQVTSSKSSGKNGMLLCCSDVPRKVFVGVSRIWVLSSERRKGIGSALIDAMRSNFIPYHFLSTTEFAFSDPTDVGMKFAEQCCKMPDFLVYRGVESS